MLLSRNDGGGGGCTAIVVAAQQWRRSDGAQRWQKRWRRGGAAMAMTAQRQLRRRSDGNGDGSAVMGVAVVVVAVAVVHHPPLFACGCSSAAPDPSSLCTICRSPQIRDALLSLSLTSGMYFPILHIFNIGTPYTQTDGHQTPDDSLIISAMKCGIIRYKRWCVHRKWKNQMLNCIQNIVTIYCLQYCITILLSQYIVYNTVLPYWLVTDLLM